MSKKKKTVECCLGIRCVEPVAKYVDDLVKELPKDKIFNYRRKSTLANAEFVDGERADISFITTEEIDRDREKVVANGIDITQYQANPVVLFDHDYTKPIGHCAWIKPKGNGLIGKTIYAHRPASHPKEVEWFPDSIYELVKQRVLIGKSIGFLPLSVRSGTREEQEKGMEVVVDKSLLLEYSCVSLPCCPNALVQAVTKGMTIQPFIKFTTKPPPQKKKFNFSKMVDEITFDTSAIAKEALELINKQGGF